MIRAMIETANLPLINAILNSSSFTFLLLGYYFIRKKKIKAHKACMLTVFGLSILFLISYVTYHSMQGSRAFQGEGWIRPIYFAVLISHTILAMAIVPMALVTLIRGLRGRYARHKQLARWTLPVWLYVSVTGVLIYIMLYELDLRI